MSGETGSSPGASILFGLDALRWRARARHPSAGDAVTVLLPVLLGLGAVWVARGSAPVAETRRDAAALGMLLGGPMAFLSYGVLFRGADDAFLRRLGIEPRALYAERATRLLLAGLSLAAFVGVMTLGAGRPLAPTLQVALGCVLVAWGTGAAATAASARAMALARAGQGWGCLTLGMWDADMRRVAPLVYAPLLPLLAGGAAGALVWRAGWGGVAGALAVSLLLARRAGGWWAEAVPRFGPQVQEMAFAPPPPAGEGELRVRRGAGRLLPRGAAAVWARDAVVAGRRFAWATRIVWPVAVVSLVLLARWGDDPAARTWVGAAAVIVFALQMTAVVAMGRYERATRRWIDRSLGIGPLQRLLGRWAWAWGATLWLAVPLAAAWSWWTDAGPGWPWLLVGAATAAVGALASTAAAGWR